MTTEPSRDFVKDFRAYADHPAHGGMVPIHPDTLRAAADEIERLQRSEALLSRACSRYFEEQSQ